MKQQLVERSFRFFCIPCNQGFRDDGGGARLERLQRPAQHHPSLPPPLLSRHLPPINYSALTQIWIDRVYDGNSDI